MRMQQYQHRSLQQQKGVAAVWMGLLLVPIMGVTFWAVEGTRYVQESSRLRDSAEAAAMAVTIEDQPGSARDLATKYVENYVRDIKSINLSAQRFYQAEDMTTDILEYIQYTVNARTTHDSWFASSFIPSFDKQQELAGRSLARKYPAYLGDNNIDIVFVSDFSGSMNDRWGPSWNKKIYDLKTAIAQISNKILCKKIRQDFVDGEWKDVCDEPGEDTTGDKLLNRVGFVPFNVRTREIVAGNRANATSQLSYKNRYNPYLSPYSYNDIDWDYWRTYSQDQVIYCAERQRYCPFPKWANSQYAKRIRDVIYSDRYAVADVYNYVDLPTSVSTMFTDKSRLKPNFYGVSGTRLFNAHGSSNSSQFYNIRLTNKLSDLSSIRSMQADGGTAAFQGILRGSQILHDGDPKSSDEEAQQDYNKKIKMLLILSDGQESPNNGILKGLVDTKMCDKARTEIPGLYIGVIGIDFRASQQSGFQDCVVNPSEDIIDVSNLDELIEKIEELIRKGSKTSGITKLY
ncbi:TadE/TadG family type IV pilus assembly protein [Vibrio sp. Vb1574]|uniref:TadE/TadG family type IV pilus assembly protein n=1 Tax=Vibrio sp. Vb1574 TaxID=3074643 RepID=UPI002964CE89|nr:TadE/TadG family type IV pilus assembly protein [Vibrio sp. Vb1574]MDW1889707.1 TadE/TadG family type IV pilus assembly protein [Vibrio sp. Vb1574]